jgi:hypothetical protein
MKAMAWHLVVTTLFLLVVLLMMTHGCMGHEFMVGGDGGWVERLAEMVNHWAEHSYPSKYNDRHTVPLTNMDDELLGSNS